MNPIIQAALNYFQQRGAQQKAGMGEMNRALADSQNGVPGAKDYVVNNAGKMGMDMAMGATGSDISPVENVANGAVKAVTNSDFIKAATDYLRNGNNGYNVDVINAAARKVLDPKQYNDLLDSGNWIHPKYTPIIAQRLKAIDNIPLDNAIDSLKKITFNNK
jgi:hypothetical protein